MDTEKETREAVALLSQLIATPRISRDETAAADIMERWMEGQGMHPVRLGNNLLLVADGFDASKETIILNAHIDTVRPSESWTRQPNTPTREGDRLYGIGANDCGGGLVSLLMTYRKFSMKPRFFNLIYIASCEEEVSGAGGMKSVVPALKGILSRETGVSEEAIDFNRFTAIVGEPTQMQPAVAEKGLMVVDMVAHGKSGHAARGEGVNAIYEALDDILWVRNYRFEKVSDFLGPTVMNLTVINGGTVHNVVPDECRMVIDVRSNEFYRNEELFNIIQSHVRSEVKARSFTLSSSRIPLDNPLVVRCREMGMQPFGSPTLSDQALMPWKSIKLGPGNSARSHSADEYICISEIQDALEKYARLLS